MDQSQMKIEWAGQNFTLLPERALLWPEKSTLILSDVHLGKAHDFQAAGAPIPGTIHDDDIERMGRLLREHDPERVFVLGDFVHSHRTELETLAENFRRMKNQFRAKWILTIGNHDRAATGKLGAWDFAELRGEISEEGIRFSHGHASGQGFSMIGHIHPVYKVGSGRDRMRLPCFWRGEEDFVIPSFGAFTGGYEIKPKPREKVYVIVHDHVVEVPTREAKRPNGKV